MRAAQFCKRKGYASNSLRSQRTMVGSVSGVCPMWPPGKTRGGLGAAVLQQQVEVLDGGLEVVLSVHDQRGTGGFVQQPLGLQ